jgi:hypothetical protein
MAAAGKTQNDDRVTLYLTTASIVLDVKKPVRETGKQ